MRIRPLVASELDAAFDLDAEAFHQGEEKRAAFVRFTDPARVVGAFEGGRLVAMSAALELGQYFGGRPVPMGGLSSVAVVPEARSGGLSKRVVRACIDAMRERGEVVSSLFPATTRLYRSLGWELAGSVAVRKLVPAGLRSLPRPQRGRARRFEARDAPALRAAYDRLAVPANGCLARPPSWWERLLHGWQERDVYVFEADGGLEGYLVYSQLDGEYTHLGGDFSLRVEELVTTGRDAALGLLRLLGSWASQVGEVYFRHGIDDTLLLVLPEQVFQTLAEIRWMTRVIDAAGAIGARGFPPDLDLEVPLRLRDELVDANAGDFVLRVQKGRGELAKARTALANGDPALDVRGLASLYTGWAPTAGLARAGLLEGGTPAQRAALDAAFAGPRPWMLDEF